MRFKNMIRNNVSLYKYINMKKKKYIYIYMCVCVCYVMIHCYHESYLFMCIRICINVYTFQRMWNGGITNIGRGRGSSVDRGGRGRTGRGSLYSSHYSRVGFDDSGDGIRIEGQLFQVKQYFY